MMRIVAHMQAKWWCLQIYLLWDLVSQIDTVVPCEQKGLYGKEHVCGFMLCPCRHGLILFILDNLCYAHIWEWLIIQTKNMYREVCELHNSIPLNFETHPSPLVCIWCDETWWISKKKEGTAGWAVGAAQTPENRNRCRLRHRQSLLRLIHLE